MNVNSDGELYHRDLPDGRYIAVVPLMYSRARIVIGVGDVLDDGW